MGRTLRRSLTSLLLVTVAGVVLAAAASAGQVSRLTVHEEGVELDADFCDVPGLDVNIAFVFDFRAQIHPRGSEGLVYFLQHGATREVFTNPANGKSISTSANTLDKDMRVTDNGDGTLTVLILSTGNAVVYDSDGKAIGRDPGQMRFEILVDDGGTPKDPYDDVLITDEIVKGSTGRSDDFCAAALPALS